MSCKGKEGSSQKEPPLLRYTWPGRTLFPNILTLPCATALVVCLSSQLKCKPLHIYPQHNNFTFLVAQIVPNKNFFFPRSSTQCPIMLLQLSQLPQNQGQAGATLDRILLAKWFPWTWFQNSGTRGKELGPA